MKNKSARKLGQQTQTIHGGEPRRHAPKLPWIAPANRSQRLRASPHQLFDERRESPDAARGMVHHFLSFAAPEGPPELRAVGDHIVHAVLRIGMRIGEDQRAS